MQPKRFRNEVALQPPQSPAARAPTLDRDGESRTGKPDLRLGGQREFGSPRRRGAQVDGENRRAARSLQGRRASGLIRYLNAETNKALANPTIANKLAELGVVVTLHSSVADGAVVWGHQVRRNSARLRAAYDRRNASANARSGCTIATKCVVIIPGACSRAPRRASIA